MEYNKGSIIVALANNHCLARTSLKDNGQETAFQLERSGLVGKKVTTLSNVVRPFRVVHAGIPDMEVLP